jgi:hypothetical protein
MVKWLFPLLVCVTLPGWQPRSAIAAQAEDSELIAAERARQQAVEQQQTRIRVEHLAHLEQELQQQRELETRKQEALWELNGIPATAWAGMLRTNMPVYLDLRQQAAHAPRLSVPCTICDGRGSLSFCVVCRGDGRCFRCSGTGKMFGRPCPVCHGKGKCYLCFGTGKMTCPFCDDGEVYSGEELPSAAVPMPGAAVFKVLPQQNLRVQHDFRSDPPSERLPVQQSEEPVQPATALVPSQTVPYIALGVALLLAAVLAVRKVVLQNR